MDSDVIQRNPVATISIMEHTINEILDLSYP